jgi:DNA replication protein DnaC
VIDDVEKAKHSEFTEEVYFEIVDERTKAGRPIAISTNRLGDLEQYVGGAVCSRLSIGQIAVEMMGADYRLEL